MSVDHACYPTERVLLAIIVACASDHRGMAIQLLRPSWTVLLETASIGGLSQLNSEKYHLIFDNPSSEEYQKFPADFHQISEDLCKCSMNICTGLKNWWSHYHLLTPKWNSSKFPRTVPVSPSPVHWTAQDNCTIEKLTAYLNCLPLQLRVENNS